MTTRRAKYYNVNIPIEPDYCPNPNLKHMTEMVWRGKDICIEFDYPLDKMYGFTFIRKGGWTVGQIIEKILAGYLKIYTNESKYGVWGHRMSDLSLEGIRVSFPKGGPIVRLDVGS